MKPSLRFDVFKRDSFTCRYRAYLDAALHLAEYEQVQHWGQEFHASKEQRTRDAKRDRFFMEQGWRVARFTGTEIFKDVHKCVKDVLRLVVEGKK